tara:strand:- start:55 stop:1230 length:1176 start_codon:yes stop_codon:yes gene_type:complete
MTDNLDKYLLTPGPLTTSQLTKEAMLRDIGSWDSDFKKVTAAIREKLVNILMQTSNINKIKNFEPYISIPMQGSGTFSVEAMLGTFVPKKNKALILSNGSYGKRCSTILNYLGRENDIIDMGDFLPPDPELLEKKLRQDQYISHVIVIQCETSSGILNPIKTISKIVKSFNKSLLIDSMSAFGAIPIDCAEIEFDALVSSANKCIEGVPGFGFVLTRKSVIENTNNNSHSLSLDFYDQWKYMEETGQWRFTPPTHTILGFLSALNQHASEGGVLGRLNRYEKNKNILVEGMRELGFETLLPDKWISPIIVSFLYPADENFNFGNFYNFMKDQGFILYPGKLTKIDTFRIGCIGQIDNKIMKRVLNSVKVALSKMRVKSATPKRLVIEERQS